MKKIERLISFQKEFIIYLLPPGLIIACYLAFHFFITVVNTKQGYLWGMIFYWLIGCLIPVFLWISKRSRVLLLQVKKINWWQSLLLILPIVLALFFGPFKQRIHDVATWIIILSLPYAFINAFCEEFLWRGLFFAHHQGNFFYAVIVPSIWFGVWHYVPLSVQPASIGNLSFILITIGLGLCWGTVAYYTRSVFWNIISHGLLDWTGIGILFYFS